MTRKVGSFESLAYNFKIGNVVAVSSRLGHSENSASAKTGRHDDFSIP